MKNLLCIAVLVSVTLSAHAAETVRFASSATYPPFESLDANNQFVGFDIDLAKALCQQMQTDCSFTNHAFDGLISALKFKRYDAIISGIDITSARQQQVAFTQPYFSNSAIIITKKDQYASLEQMSGRRVGMENGTTHQKYLQENYPDINPIAYDSYQNAILDLKNGRLDGVFGDTAVVNEWLKTNPDLGSVGTPITDPNYFGMGLGIAVHLENTVLLARLNQALSAIRENGTYQQVYDKWFAQ